MVVSSRSMNSLNLGVVTSISATDDMFLSIFQCADTLITCRASGASSHVSRLRTPAQTRRSALFASLRNSAFATVWDPVSGQQVRGKVTAVEYKPGLKIEPVWESLPFETQQLVNSPAAKSPVTPDLPSARYEPHT